MRRSKKYNQRSVAEQLGLGERLTGSFFLIRGFEMSSTCSVLLYISTSHSVIRTSTFISVFPMFRWRNDVLPLSALLSASPPRVPRGLLFKLRDTQTCIVGAARDTINTRHVNENPVWTWQTGQAANHSTHRIGRHTSRNSDASLGTDLVALKIELG